MGKPIVIAVMQGADPYWMIIASCLHEPVPFLGSRAAPTGFVEGILAPEAPTQVVVLNTLKNRVESSWYYDPVRGKRRLQIIGEANGSERCEEPQKLTITQIRPLGAAPRPWCVTSTNNPALRGHDSCQSVEDAVAWLKINKSKASMLVLIHTTNDRIDKAYSVHDSTWIEVPLDVKHPRPGEDPNLYSGTHNGATDRLPEARPQSFRCVTIRPTGDKTEYAVASDDGASVNRPDRETACVYAHSLGDQFATVLLLEHDRHDKTSSAFICLDGTWSKLPPSVARFLARKG